MFDQHMKLEYKIKRTNMLSLDGTYLIMHFHLIHPVGFTTCQSVFK